MKNRVRTIKRQSDKLNIRSNSTSLIVVLFNFLMAFFLILLSSCSNDSNYRYYSYQVKEILLF
ncbi:MAG: hypothetical protein IIU69_01775, partial [Bacteroidaceae bacterium]|nr:hypothetical protein [Bacteroidaceae bacterium]